MTVFGSFTEKGVKDMVSQNAMKIANFSLMIAVGFCMTFLSLRYVLPNDVFTSALFFDSLELQPVFAQPAGAFAEGGIWEDLPDVTTEALVFAASLLVIQIFAGYRASMAGPWTGESSNILALLINSVRSKPQNKKGHNWFNWGKLGWMGMYWVVAVFDTATDAVYRSGFGTTSILLALVVSFLFYNLFSEWAAITGSKTMINYGLQIINLIRRYAFQPHAPKQRHGSKQSKGKQPKQSKGKPPKNSQQRGRKARQSQSPNRPLSAPKLHKDLQEFLNRK